MRASKASPTLQPPYEDDRRSDVGSAQPSEGQEERGPVAEMLYSRWLEVRRSSASCECQADLLRRVYAEPLVYIDYPSRCDSHGQRFAAFSLSHSLTYVDVKFA